MTGRRRHSRPLAAVFIILVILAIGVWIFFPRPKNPYGRKTYILVSDPIVIASWSEADRVLTLISFPSDIAAEGTHGYGTYSLAAFWRLGEIDKKDGTVLVESVSEALGIPVTGYIGPKTGEFSFGDEALVSAKSIFSLKHVFGVIGGRYRTNIPLKQFIDLAWLLNFSRPDRVNTYDFTNNTARVAQDSVLPDGSIVRILDPQRVDNQLKTVFEDESVRRESVTVAVYNTTTMPSLGNRIGRLLANIGVSVVTIGNDTPETDACIVAGSEQTLKSKSAQVIVAVLGCNRVVGDTSRADLIIRIGKTYAKRFVPN
ncbi:MAG: LytR C-terminal domain-containing protein [Candidatus Gottesmanbacteria bacterium]|nr:LytR C-terminal domain-containing protein [Candidatus Gottesmanbacteria bacterium]